MQNCEEKIPTIDLTESDEVEVEYFLCVVSQVCLELAAESCVAIKITKNET